MTGATCTSLYTPQAQLHVCKLFIVYQSGEFTDTSKKRKKNKRNQLPNELIEDSSLVTFKHVENLLIVHLFTEHVSYMKEKQRKIGVLSLIIAISSLLHNPLYYINNSHKQSLSLCFDTELLPVLRACIPSRWLFQPLLSLRGKHKTPDQAITLVKTLGLGFYPSLLMFGLFL